MIETLPRAAVSRHLDATEAEHDVHVYRELPAFRPVR